MTAGRLTYRITTLGCRVNHAETREIETVLLDRGLRRAAPAIPADLEVVHTCSVTGAAAAKSRQAVRRATRRSDDGARCDREVVGSGGAHPAVIVTGCYAETHRAEAAGLTGDARNVLAHEDAPDAGGRDSVLADRFARRVDDWIAGRRGSGTAPPAIRPPGPGSSRTPDALVPLPVFLPPASGRGERASSRHVRAEVRIQDGCDAHCTFCIIPKIRRTLRSKRIQDAVAETRRLVDLGHREIVLSGVFIGAYGHETALRRNQSARARGAEPLARPRAEPLADLIDAVAAVPGLARLRLSSMEPGDATETLLDAMVANTPVVVPHLHLPLQSGSDAILRRMNRQYRVGDYLEMIDLVETRLTTDDGLPPAITTDVICGFPGETDDDFGRTVAVARRVGYLHMHVFPYSVRAGTAAARWRTSFVDERVRRSRVRELIDLEEDPRDGLSMRYRRRLLGRTVRLILEQPDRVEPTLMTGRIDHYALVHVPTTLPRGSVVEAVVTEVTADRTVASIVPSRASLTIGGRSVIPAPAAR